jgi:hypothetical protein
LTIQPAKGVTGRRRRKAALNELNRVQMAHNSQFPPKIILKTGNHHGHFDLLNLKF